MYPIRTVPHPDCLPDAHSDRSPAVRNEPAAGTSLWVHVEQHGVELEGQRDRESCLAGAPFSPALHTFHAER